MNAYEFGWKLGREKISIGPRQGHFNMLTPYLFGLQFAQEKRALEVLHGGLPARAIASTLGHIGSFPNALIMSPRTHQNASQWEGAGGTPFDRHIAAGDQRAQKLKTLAQDMARARPQELSNTRVYLGGPRLFEEMVRGYTNPRTSILNKALSTLSTPFNYGYTALTRGDAYNPTTDSVYQYGNSPSVLSHELGHAIDWNSKPVSKSFLGRQWQGLKRDIGGVVMRAPGLNVLNEAAANNKSLQALQDAYKKQPGKLQPILNERQRVLPAGMGGYLTASALATAAAAREAADRLPQYAPQLAQRLAPITSALSRVPARNTLAGIGALLASVGAGKIYGMYRAARNAKPGA